MSAEQPLVLSPQSTALVLIDLQRGILPFAQGPHSPEQVLGASARLAKRFRELGAPVVLVRVALLVRGLQRRPASPDAAPRSHDLFLQGRRSEAAWRFTEQEQEQRRRAVFQGTVMLRNLAAARESR